MTGDPFVTHRSLGGVRRGMAARAAAHQSRCRITRIYAIRNPHKLGRLEKVVNLRL
jgi:hypothetical protein